jgi:N-[(2S)-2-amino-2-carboxyethyl]-L-glutamate dehydrogenase
VAAGIPRASAVLILNDHDTGYPFAVLESSIISAIHTFLTGTGWSFDEIGVHDLSAASAAGFHDYLNKTGTSARTIVHDTAEQLIRSAELVVFATIAGQPHISDLSWFAHHPLVLHVSLRDLAPQILLGPTNIVDDVEHCLKPTPPRTWPSSSPVAGTSWLAP